jgi:hypothetical protein
VIRRLALFDGSAALVLASLLVACQAQPSAGIVPPGQMELGIANLTSIEVVLVVDGQTIQTVEPHTRTEVPASRLPPLPWAAEVRLPTGRSLVSVTVNAGDVRSTTTPNGGTEQRGVGARVDLSCGRIDLYSGPVMMGPAPGPGSPGDCDP